MNIKLTIDEPANVMQNMRRRALWAWYNVEGCVEDARHVEIISENGGRVGGLRSCSLYTCPGGSVPGSAGIEATGGQNNPCNILVSIRAGKTSALLDQRSI